MASKGAHYILSLSMLMGFAAKKMVRFTSSMSHAHIEIAISDHACNATFSLTIELAKQGTERIENMLLFSVEICCSRGKKMYFWRF